MIRLLLAALLIGPAARPQPVTPPRFVRAAGDDRLPGVSIWTDRAEDPFGRGEEARVYFRTDEDAYVTVLRVDADGRIRVLFPREPWENSYARGGRAFEVLGRGDDYAFRVDDNPGVGYVFAVVSPSPFRYDEFARGDHWDYRMIADGRVSGDPYVALTDFADRIAEPDEYNYDIAPYYVERHYDYPRFVCYDCHTYASYRYWNPYDYTCSRFRIVIYDDPFYSPYYPYRAYPYRYYGGRRVVLVRPHRPGPRYVFKDADDRHEYVTRLRTRTPDDLDRRRLDRGRTGDDVGGRGTIPAPIVGREPGRRPVTGGRRGDDDGGTPTGRGRGDPHSNPPGVGDPHQGTDRGDPHRDGRGRPAPAERSGPPSAEPRRHESPNVDPGRTHRPNPEVRDRPRQEPPARAPERRSEPPRQERPAPEHRPSGESTGDPELRRRRS